GPSQIQTVHSIKEDSLSGLAQSLQRIDITAFIGTNASKTELLQQRTKVAPGWEVPAGFGMWPSQMQTVHSIKEDSLLELVDTLQNNVDTSQIANFPSE
ncbi:hypothetical protein BGZ88_003843, partial [Linnemannia elongata]